LAGADSDRGLDFTGGPDASVECLWLGGCRFFRAFGSRDWYFGFRDWYKEIGDSREL
jgi:hypothetical protein